MIGPRATMVADSSVDLYWKTGPARDAYRLKPNFASCCNTENCRSYNGPSAASSCDFNAACSTWSSPIVNQACCDYCNANTGETGITYPENDSPNVLIPTKSKLDALGNATSAVSFERSYFIWGVTPDPANPSPFNPTLITGQKYYVKLERNWHWRYTPCVTASISTLTTNRNLATPFYIEQDKLKVAAPAGTAPASGTLDFQITYLPTTGQYQQLPLTANLLSVEAADNTAGVVDPKYNKFGIRFVAGSDDNPRMYALNGATQTGISFRLNCGNGQANNGTIMLHGNNNSANGQFNAHFLEMVVPSDDWVKRDYTAAGLGSLPTGTGTGTGTRTSTGTGSAIVSTNTGTRISTSTGTSAAVATRTSTGTTAGSPAASSNNIALYVGIGAGVLVLLIIIAMLGRKKAVSSAGEAAASSVSI
jgi:hypothetical protein